MNDVSYSKRLAPEQEMESLIKGITKELKGGVDNGRNRLGNIFGFKVRVTKVARTSEIQFH